MDINHKLSKLPYSHGACRLPAVEEGQAERTPEEAQKLLQEMSAKSQHEALTNLVKVRAGTLECLRTSMSQCMLASANNDDMIIKVAY